MRLRFIDLALVSIGFFIFTLTAFSAEDAMSPSEDPSGASIPSQKVKYRAQKTVNFEELLIQGEKTRPEITVVTGNTAQGSDGLLRLRENFYDRMKAEAGEEMP